MRRETIAGAAALLAEAHRAGRRFDRLPPQFRPQDVATAYAIQDTMVGALGGVGRLEGRPDRK